MELRRHYHISEGWTPVRNSLDANGRLTNPKRAPGAVLNAPGLSHIEVYDTGTTPAQHFTSRFVERGKEEGWLTIENGILTIYAEPENLVYRVLRVPGRYSCFDGRKLPDDDTGALARAYLAEHHAGQPSPDPENPAGYRMINYYDCLLSAEQHERFRIKERKV